MSELEPARLREIEPVIGLRRVRHIESDRIFSAASIGHIEATGADEAEKAALVEPALCAVT